jgi:ABC-2 type transport system permease protein
MKLRPVYAVIEREVVRMFRQRTRLLSAMVRPLIWLLVIGGGFGAVISETRGIPYQQFLESGVMRMMIVAPLPHGWIVSAKLLSAALAAIIQCLLLLGLLAVLGYLHAGVNWGLLLVALTATSLACGGIGMVTASFSRTLDNFAAIMNFVIFPVFFLSGSLYPVRDLPELLQWVALANPYTYAVDLLKHAVLPVGAMGADFSIWKDFAVLAGFTLAGLAAASWRFSQESAYEPMIHVLTGKRG